ncbi:MAG: helix-turn-helix domain-containing protein [Verrucomicrobiaceae bacterium]|nr:helix-turn-helix domain-containing protein [Verrucomicrobiaceae bacterium]
MISETHPEHATTTGSSRSSVLLPLLPYDRDLCGRLALSPKTSPAVKRTARLLLEMARSTDLSLSSARTGIGKDRLRQIRQTYLQHGLQEVLEHSVAEPPPPFCRQVTLTAEERAFCQQVVSSGDPEKGRTRRARALLLLEQGHGKAHAAGATGISERTIERLLERYQTHGVAGCVNDAGRRGRPVVYARDEYVPLILQIVQGQPPATLLRWTVGDLRRMLAQHRREAAEISAPTLRALVHQAGLHFRPSAGRPRIRPAALSS